MITVKRPQGQKDESKGEKERRAGLEGENRTRKEDRKKGGRAESMQPAGSPGGSSPAPPPTSTHRRGVITTGHLYTWWNQLLFLEPLISFHSFCASQAGNLEEGECAVPTHWAPVFPEVPWERPHSPRCGPCWRPRSVPAARLGSSSARLAGPGPTTTRRSAGSGERRRGPSVHCGPARTGLSYPSGPPGVGGGRSKGRHSWASLCHSDPHVLWTNSIPPQMYGVRVPLCVSGESLSELLQLMHCSRPRVPSVDLVITRHPPRSLCLSRKWPGASSSLGSRYEGRQNLFFPTLVTWVKYP